MMTCEECAPLLTDSVDGTLSPEDAAALGDHLRTCTECGALLQDLLAIRHATDALDHPAPAAEIWERIAGRTVNREARFGLPGASSTTRFRDFGFASIAAAAILVLAIAGGTWQYLAYRADTSPVTPNDVARNAESEIREAESHYDKAIAALEQLTAGQQSALDPRVATAIAQSLETIDRAIADSRAALHDHPDSAVAQASLLAALRMKVSLLQETMSLVNSRS